MGAAIPMSAAVNLLLLLSALLTALTGAGPGARAPQPAVAVSRIADATATQQVTARRSVTRPPTALSAPWVAPALRLVALRLPAPVPLFLSRRRE